MLKKYFVFLFLIVVFAFSVNAQSKQVVKFPRGKTKVTLKGTITGYKYIDYIFAVKKTQYFSAKLTGGKAQMVVFEPDNENMPDAAGITEITSQVEVSGKYRIRVLMSRNEARLKSAKSAFTLVLEVAELK